MKVLIQICAFWPEYEQMAELLEKSFRQTNCWIGGPDWVELDIVKEPEFDLKQLAVPCGEKVLAKVFYGTMGDWSRYDRVILMDADMLFLHSIQTFLTLEFADIALFSESRNVPEKDWHYFYDKVSYRENTPGYNSGFVMARGRDWQDICQLWWDTIRTDHSWDSKTYDQTALNGIILDKMLKPTILPNWMMATFKTSIEPQRITGDTILLHFNTPERLAVMQRVTELIALYEKIPAATL